MSGHILHLSVQLQRRLILQYYFLGSKKPHENVQTHHRPSGTAQERGISNESCTRVRLRVIANACKVPHFCFPFRQPSADRWPFPSLRRLSKSSTIPRSRHFVFRDPFPSHSLINIARDFCLPTAGMGRPHTTRHVVRAMEETCFESYRPVSLCSFALGWSLVGTSLFSTATRTSLSDPYFWSIWLLTGLKWCYRYVYVH